MEQNSDHISQFTSIAKAKGFLGREFLTWLWYVAETTKERLIINSYDIDLWVDDRISLEGTAAMSHQHLMKGGDPSHSREAATALSTGKTVRELKLGCRIKGIGEFTTVLHCDDLSPRSLTLPSPDSDQNAETAKDTLPISKRLEAMASFLAVLDGLFSLFMEKRTAPTWEDSDLTHVREWIKKRQSKVESETLH